MLGSSLLKTGAKLRFDGVYECDTLEQVINCLLDGVPPRNIFCEIPETKVFNNKVDESQEFAKKVEYPLSYDWIIPEFYQSLDVFSYVLSKLDAFINNEHPAYQKYLDRICIELEYFEDTNSMDFVRCVIFTLEEMTSRGLFWGVGRGSSCACLVFFLLDLHKIDPIKYNLPLNDFFK